MSQRHSALIAILSAFALALPAAVSAPASAAKKIETPEAQLNKAVSSYREGRRKDALDQVNLVISKKPEYGHAWFIRGQMLSESGDHTNAVKSFDTAIKLEPQASPAYQQRGQEHFFLANVDKSAADFDKYLELVPAQAPYHWQRGISLYYAGRYTDGRKQFELHQSVNSNDVENAVWHFLCVARESGIAKARELLIPITGDARIPMMQVHELFANKIKPEDVLAAAKAGNPSPQRLEQHLFYAHLYLGLYYEALGDQNRTREYIQKAAEKSASYDYMGAVARVHAKILGLNQPGQKTKDAK